MAVNDNAIKIRNQIFGGDIGAEAKLQNDAIMALLLRQDAIIEAMSTTVRAKYDTLISEHQDFLNDVKAGALDNYSKIKVIRS